MRASFRMRTITLGALAAAGVLGASWSARSTTTPRPAATQFGGGMMAVGGFGGVGVTAVAEPPNRVVYLREPSSTRALLIRTRLSQPLDMPFDHDTPLEDVIKYIQNSTECPELEEGIPFYLDPAGLTEAEKTPSSPVVLNMKGIPLAKTLRLMLSQLGLTYTVDEDGFVHITSAGATDAPIDSSQAILDELAQLRREVAELKALHGGGGERGGTR